MVILDTSILIDHLRQISSTNQSVFQKINKAFKEKDLAISVLTIQELYAGQSTKLEEIDQAIKDIILKLKVLAYDSKIARKAGEIERDTKEKIGLADAAIAATAVIEGYKLLTLNTKHFIGITDLEFEKIPDKDE